VRPVSLLALLLVLAGTVAAQARPFGRNKVQYDEFDWRVLHTEHLEIHFYPEEEALARRAAEYGEEACRHLDEELGHTLTRRIPLIVYGSHHAFRQNNVLPSLVGESTGGFTEIFRNRVVLPYAGSEPDFRHVVHHELVHAYVFDRLYGGPIKSLFVLQYAFHMPLWFMEGIAEYYSAGWDSEGEMMLRDAALGGVLPPFPRIYGGYFVYKAGPTAIAFLAAKHGDDVVRRILDDVSSTRDVRLSVKNVTGESLEDLGKEWQLEWRKRTWPTIADLDEAETYGRVLPAESGGAIDSHPGLSPDGSRVVFLSDRSGTPDLWLLDTAEDAGPARVLVHGARGAQYESLHPLHSTVGWSPDGKFVVAAAQKESRDALYVIDVDDRETVAELQVDLDAVERPDWSPDQARFVFTGMIGGQVDLWAVEADGTNLTQLTNDLHDERGPRWSPDGRRVLFTTDRGGDDGLDLWTVDVESGAMRPLVAERGDQWDGCWSGDGRSVYYGSDEHGTRDLMRRDVATGEAVRLTRLVGGAGAPSVAREGGQLAFNVYEKGRFRVVLVEDPDSLQAVTAPDVPIEDPFWWKTYASADSAAADSTSADSASAADADLAAADPAQADSAGVDSAPDPAPDEPAKLDPVEPHVADYDPRLRPEWLAGSLGYSGFGFNLGVQTEVTDVLGNHRLALGANVFRSVENTDAYLGYRYLADRLDYGVSVFHFRDYLYDDRTALGQPIGEEGEDARFSERQWGTSGVISYPFHTFRRVDLEVAAMTIDRETYERVDDHYRQVDSERSSVLRPTLSHTFDNTLWGWTGPVQGSRSVLSAGYVLPLGGQPIEFSTVLADFRRYSRYGDYVLALRGMATASFGPDPRELQLGGPNTIRGHDRQSIRGRNAALASIEFRYPFLEYVRLGWPLRSAFGGVRGNLFLDVGTAFDDPERARLTGPNVNGDDALKDLFIGFGFGARARVAFLPIRIDCGWPTDGARTGKPNWEFALGPEF
jgi:Tol biopolymer transport system component